MRRTRAVGKIPLFIRYYTNGYTAATLRATFLLRVIRQIRQHPPKREEDVLFHLNWFGLFLVPRLHSLVATGVGKKSFETVEKLLNKRKWSGKLASKALWEGEGIVNVFCVLWTDCGL